jgi:superfamily I DNA/RNA helicase
MEQSLSLFSQIRLSADNQLADFLMELNRLRSCKDDATLFIDCLRNFPNLIVADNLFPDVGLTIDAFASSEFSLRDLLEELYERFGLLDPEDEIPEEEKVLLATMHSSKGLEAEFVFLTRLNRRLLPQPGMNRAEQLRVLYVAMTRARQEDFFLYSDVYDQARGRKVDGMSPFLEIIRSHLSIERIKKQDLKKYN